MTLNEFMQTYLSDYDKQAARARFFSPEPDDVVQRKINTITSLDELYGFIGRNAVLKVNLAAWPENQRRMFVAKKLNLQKGGYANHKITK